MRNLFLHITENVNIERIFKKCRMFHCEPMLSGKVNTLKKLHYVDVLQYIFSTIVYMFYRALAMLSCNSSEHITTLFTNDITCISIQQHRYQVFHDIILYNVQPCKTFAGQQGSYSLEASLPRVKGTQDWDFFCLRFWNLYYFFISYVKILRFYQKIFLIRPLLGEIRFSRLVWD